MLKQIKCSKKDYKIKLEKFISSDSENNLLRARAVSKIIEKVRNQGDKALLSLSKRFDKVTFKKTNEFLVTSKEFKEADRNCSKDFHKALKEAADRISQYQKRLLPKPFYFKDKEGINLGCIWTSLSSCGLYVPGGKAFYPSSVLMNAIPANIAGVKRIVMTTPTNNNKIKPEILVAAKVAGIKEVYKIGGAQAIAALTYGTKLIKKVDKIVGPGNAYVAEAKRQVFGYVGIDSIAGPSEVLIIADRYCNPKWVAIDLISQAEHDEEARAILITDDADFLKQVNKYIKYYLKKINRSAIASISIKKNGLGILMKNLNEAYLVSNYIAPEHLQIMSKNKKNILKKIVNAGAIFIGQYSPEALGDYIAGPSHVLPTSGNARFDSGLSVLDFLKRTSYIEASKKGLYKVIKPIEIIGNSEGLDAHVKSALIRFSKGS